MTRRAFLRSLTLGLAVLQLRFRPAEPVAPIAPANVIFVDWTDIVFSTTNPNGPEHWAYRQWMKS